MRGLDMKEPMRPILVGLLAASLAAYLQWTFWFWLEPNRFILFYPAVILSSLLAGLYGGLSATVVSTILAAYIFFEPAFSFDTDKHAFMFPTLLFLAVGCGIANIVNIMQRRLVELTTEKTQRIAEHKRLGIVENMLVGYAQCEMIFDDRGHPVDFVCHYVNPAFEKLTGLHDATGKKICDLIPGLNESNPELFELYGRVARGGAPEVTETYLHQLASWFTVSAYYPGEENRFAITFDNITRRKQAEEERERLAAIVEYSDDAIISKDLNGIIETWNRGAEELFGYTAQEAIGRSISILIPPELQSEEQSLLRRLEDGERVAHFETVRLTKGQLRVDVSVTSSPLRDAHGRVVGVAKIVRDIRESKRQQAEYITSKEVAENALRIKSRFLDIAAHELRTPVTAFSLLLQFTQMQLEKKGKPVDVPILMRLRAQADRLSRLSVDLLDISRLERGVLSLKRVPTNLLSVISECLDICRLRAPDRRFTLAAPAGPIEITLDHDRIFQVLSNLLDNAIKYTPENTPIEVAIETTPERVRVSVKDHGLGIPEQQQRVLFNPFGRETANQVEQVSGLGLGLFVCRGIIELHGGKIGMKSEEGVGSTFFFDLPWDIAARKAA